MNAITPKTVKLIPTTFLIVYLRNTVEKVIKHSKLKFMTHLGALNRHKLLLNFSRGSNPNTKRGNFSLRCTATCNINIYL